jgi:hypothetical protein
VRGTASELANRHSINSGKEEDEDKEKYERRTERIYTTERRRDRKRNERAKRKRIRGGIRSSHTTRRDERAQIRGEVGTRVRISRGFQRESQFPF